MSFTHIQQSELYDYEESLDERISRLDKPWRSEAVLRDLYLEQELTLREVARRLECNHMTVRNWLEKHGISRREAGKPRVERASYCITPGGYGLWVVRNGDSITTVGVHRLLAIADGADPHRVFGEEGTHVHHRAGDSALNLPGLVEVLPNSEHKLIHERGSFEMNDDGIPVLSHGGD